MEFQVRRLVSHDLELNALDIAVGRDPFPELEAKLAAEEARLRRLAPELPRGWEWDFEIQRLDDYTHNTIRHRVVGTPRRL